MTYFVYRKIKFDWQQETMILNAIVFKTFKLIFKVGLCYVTRINKVDSMEKVV